MRRNFFIFLEKAENLTISMNRLLYGADLRQNNQRSLGNAKPGDLALMWVPQTKSLYGVFEIKNRVYFDESDIGWTGHWPYRCSLSLWDGFLRFIPDSMKAELMSFVSRELVTLRDMTSLGGYIHSLLYDEGTKLLDFFIAKSKMEVPTEHFPGFSTEVQPSPTSKDFASNMRGSSDIAEYELEVYLLQHPEKLESFVGSGISEIYNMIYGYQQRYLDIMTVHRDDNGKPFKTTIIELKKRIDERELDRALDEVSSYMFWISDQIKKGKVQGNSENVNGLIISRFSKNHIREIFNERAKLYATQYGIDDDKIHYLTFTVGQGDIDFRLEV